MISFASASLGRLMSDANGSQKSAIDIEHGFGRHGSNVVHYIPSRKEIKAVCAAIRSMGFRDQSGVWHGPWDDTEHRKRAGIKGPRRVEIHQWDGVVYEDGVRVGLE